MKKTLGFGILLVALGAAGCSSGEPSGDIAPSSVKVEKMGSGTGPQPSAGAAAPGTTPTVQSGGSKAATD